LVIPNLVSTAPDRLGTLAALLGPVYLQPRMKIYTRTGDSGETALFGGGRVSKDDARVGAYGTVDELNAAIGVVLADEPRNFEQALLESIQRDLFAIGAQLATPNPDRVQKALAKADLSPDRVQHFEDVMDRAEQELPPLDAFILPGGTTKAAALHQARTTCRRAEREVVGLAKHAELPDIIIVYLNRLSDLLFTLARLANQRAHVPDRTW
jgi:cob(I)alamin adenosyltransferase